MSHHEEPLADWERDLLRTEYIPRADSDLQVTYEDGTVIEYVPKARLKAAEAQVNSIRELCKYWKLAASDYGAGRHLRVVADALLAILGDER